MRVILAGQDGDDGRSRAPEDDVVAAVRTDGFDA